MKNKASLSIIRCVVLTVMRKEIAMAMYYIGPDVHSNSTEPAVEQRRKIVAIFSADYDTRYQQGAVQLDWAGGV
jgi:hypothetical protein